MLVIGLTGGIGSGKTTATDYFARKGITIVDADIASRIVVEPGKAALTKIAEHFSSDILNSDGSLNRSALRKIVFNYPEELHWLEQLTHPLIREEIQNQIKNSSSPYTILVSPILFESGQNAFTQRTVVIDAPETLQISRTAVRDHTDPESVKAIMKAQTAREQRIKNADDVIVNDSNVESFYKQLDALHSKYLALSQTSK